jgi:hypothetical protein
MVVKILLIDCVGTKSILSPKAFVVRFTYLRIRCDIHYIPMYLKADVYQFNEHYCFLHSGVTYQKIKSTDQTHFNTNELKIISQSFIDN